MNSIIFKEEITENNYQDFIHQIIDIFRLSNYQKYIMFSLKIEKEECIIRMSILNHDGANQKYEDIVMNSTTSYFSEGYKKIKFGKEKIWIPWRVVDYNNNEFLNHTGVLFPIIYYYAGYKDNKTKHFNLTTKILNYKL